MTVYAINSGHAKRKRELAELLYDAAQIADELGMWRNGEPFASQLYLDAEWTRNNADRVEPPKET